MRRYGWWRSRYDPANYNSRKAVKKAEQIAKERELHPVVVSSTGNKIARTVWGKAWCDNLESYSDFAHRLPRGRSYLRNGAVADLRISEGEIRALVRGKDLYEVRIQVAPIRAGAWKAIREATGGKISNLMELVEGKLSPEVMSEVTKQQGGLFPTPDEIEMHCNCPDWAVMCKHVAATLYGVGVRFDEDPELLFRLRGVRAEELVQGAVVKASSASSDSSSHGKPLDGDEKRLASIFGISFEKPVRARNKKGQARASNTVSLARFRSSLPPLGRALVHRGFVSRLREQENLPWLEERLASLPGALVAILVLDSWLDVVRPPESLFSANFRYPKSPKTVAEVREAWARHVLQGEASPVVAFTWHEMGCPNDSMLFAHLLGPSGQATLVAVEKPTGDSEEARREAEQRLVDDIDSWLPAEASIILVAGPGVGDGTLIDVLDFLGWRYLLTLEPELQDFHAGSNDPDLAYDPDSLSIRREHDISFSGMESLVPVLLTLHGNKRPDENSAPGAKASQMEWQLATSLELLLDEDIVKLHERIYDVRVPHLDRKWFLLAPRGRLEPDGCLPWTYLHEQVAMQLHDMLQRAVDEVIERPAGANGPDSNSVPVPWHMLLGEMPQSDAEQVLQRLDHLVTRHFGDVLVSARA